ncbi:M55 family metallopeptidase [Halobacillus sp. ACCC02827]|uniref:M55 family metallopeptidase n=1 Tax=Halobacillus sp. ACCC02827 TaxID=3052090 RepID=UPI0025710F70|nr:M55 family metallopeptidase [Halobacillus sp. ACCC02827]WJE17116.1 M55 family metallopeptidase [Halobacillus sp. ACCC02827]
MKLYLSVDMEGITGIPDHTFVDSSKHNYERARKIMTEEVNYVLHTAYENGATEILVNDSHSKMNNLLIDDLHPDVLLITGGAKPYSMVEGLDESFDGAMFIGYHARAAMKGVLSHSMTFGVRNFYVDERAVGELGFNAYMAGHYGVPVLMVAGDDQAAMEAEDLLPNVTTAAVKETITRAAVKSLTPRKAGELLQQKTKEAIHNRSNVPPLRSSESPALAIEFMNYGQAEWAAMMPGAVLASDSTTVHFQARDIKEAYQAMLVMTDLAMRATSS